MAGFDATITVTPARVWNTDPRWSTVPELPPLRGDVVVFAAHPDDETLGVGGLITTLVRAGTRVHFVFATCGHDEESAAERREEAAAAIGILAPGATSEFYGLPDAGLKDVLPQLGTAVRATLAAHPAADVLVTWHGDRHGDHRRLAAAVADAAAGRVVLQYPIWLWQWGIPADVPWQRARTVRLDPAARERKATALGRYPSQTSGVDAVLVPDFLEHFASDREVVFVPESDDADRFDEIHRRGDPWGFETRWYERRKRALTLAALPQPRYRHALEVGCSIGVLSSELAERADELLAVDVSPVAVAAARERLHGRPNVRVHVLDAATEWPADRFDLIVLSEVGYYLEPRAWTTIATRIGRELEPSGAVLLCHWLHRESDFRQDPPAVHTRFAAASGLRRSSEHREAEFLLEVYQHVGTDPGPRLSPRAGTAARSPAGRDAAAASRDPD